MGLNHVGHAEIVRFARDKVNLPKDKEAEYVAQAKRLQDKLESYVEEHPDFELKRLIMSGSVAKGTALKQINDLDMGCYIMGIEDYNDIPKLIEFLVEKLRTAFPNFKPEQIQPNTYSVTVSFRGTGLDVDVVPIIYEGAPNWYGCVVSQRNGSLLKTSIPLHLEFIRKRKSNQKRHFSQIVRLLKFWKKEKKKEIDGFRFKSFMIELILAKLADDGYDFSNYVEGLQHFFTYLAKSNIRELIAFTDYYEESELLDYPEPVKIIDPVNAENNASKLYTSVEADMIVEAAIEAGDAIDSAIYATTKEKTVIYWQKVFGTSFNP